MLSVIGRALASSLGNAGLIAINFLVGSVILFLVAIKLVEAFEATPTVHTITCAVGLPGDDCPQYGEKLRASEEQLASARAEISDLASEKARLDAEKASTEAHIARLKALDAGVDNYTLFTNTNDPASGARVTVGTIYRTLVDAASATPTHFCYLNLDNGAAGENRNLHFHTVDGPISLSSATLRSVGVSEAALAFGRSVCKPLIVGKAEGASQ